MTHNFVNKARSLRRVSGTTGISQQGINLRMKSLCFALTVLALISHEGRCTPAEPASSRNGVPDLNKPSVGDDIEGDEVQTSIDKMTQYLIKYNQFEKPSIDPSHSSANGDADGPRENVDVTLTPSYMERVMLLEQEAGLELTGKISKALLTKTEEDRCGMVDPPSEEEGGPANYKVMSVWNSKLDRRTRKYLLTYSFHKNGFPNRDDFTHEMIEEGVLSAMCIWEWNSNVRFTENLGDNDPDAHIKISFGKYNHGDNFPFDGRGGTLAHAFYPEVGILHFDESEPWYLAKTDELKHKYRDVFTVAAHELGHNLGLYHSSKTSLMAPFYNFQGSFENYDLPQDDKNGMDSMYGYARGTTDPTRERKSACRALSDRFGVRHSRSGQGSVRPATTTTTTRATRKTTRRPPTTRRPKTTRKPTSTDTCKDDTTLGVHCRWWKSKGYCESDRQIETMRRRCKKTCDFCAVKPVETDSTIEQAAKEKENACYINKYDTVSTFYDAGNYFDVHLFKDDFLVRSTIRLDADTSSTYSLLNGTQALEDVFRWHTNPNITKPGARKYKHQFPGAKDVHGMLVMRRWYLAFQDDGTVRRYSRSSSTILHLDTTRIRDMFGDYPYDSVDAVYVETQDFEQIVTLFKGRSIWQFRHSNPRMTSDSERLIFEPIEGRSQISIKEWHGVDACNVDAVFKYKDVPYFIKGNIFWPATNKEPPIARDFTYHFLRCWDRPPKTYPIPVDCSRILGRAMDDNGALSSATWSPLLYLSTALLTTLFSLRR